MKTVLEFRDVSAKDADGYDVALDAATLSLRAGEMAIVQLPKGKVRTPLADLAQGLFEPEEGTVTFMDEAWTSMSPDAGSEARSRIGRVFEQQSWVSNLDVDENITLAERHFGRESPEAIEAQARELAAAFGLAQVPKGRPAWAKRHELRVCEWVRAFLGQPGLILLERPARDVYADAVSRLADRVGKACEGGAAVLWMESDSELWAHESLEATYRYTLKDGQLQLEHRTSNTEH